MKDGDDDDAAVALVVPRLLVKTVKSALESELRFAGRIEKLSFHPDINSIPDKNTNSSPGNQDLFLIFTNLTCGGEEDGASILPGLAQYPDVTVTKIPRNLNGNGIDGISTRKKSTNPLINAVSRFLKAQPPATPSTETVLLSTLPKRWSLYPPLLLLPQTSFTHPAWKNYLSHLAENDLKHQFYAAIASALDVTHVATNAPIPSSDHIRRPTNLTPLHGDFGPPVCVAAAAAAAVSPTQSDFDAAFWVSTRQTGIYQTWAPRYTMFSRGNVTEKARVLGFPQVAGCNVVDLYGGIGYFVFSYVVAGAALVCAWEINTWSVEAMMRGARENGWVAKLVKEGEEVGRVEEEVRILIFLEDNKHAEERLRKMGSEGSARHVNLGLLPTSRGSWETALRIVDRQEEEGGGGGWIHVHENIAEDEIESKTEEVVSVFGKIQEMGGIKGRVKCEHVERVKTFAPGVMHCVLDLHVSSGI